MPRISEFYGIVVLMFHNDHHPAHFHVQYAEFNAAFEIANGRLMHGYLPRRALALVREWTTILRQELWTNWDLAQSRKALIPIAPLS